MALSVISAAPTTRADAGVFRPIEDRVRPPVRHRTHTNGRTTRAKAVERIAVPRGPSGSVENRSMSAYAATPARVNTTTGDPIRIRSSCGRGFPVGA